MAWHDGVRDVGECHLSLLLHPGPGAESGRGRLRFLVGRLLALIHCNGAEWLLLNHCVHQILRR